jgi:hypothetical protein
LPAPRRPVAITPTLPLTAPRFEEEADELLDAIRRATLTRNAVFLGRPAENQSPARQCVRIVRHILSVPLLTWNSGTWNF